MQAKAGDINHTYVRQVCPNRLSDLGSSAEMLIHRDARAGRKALPGSLVRCGHGVGGAWVQGRVWIAELQEVEGWWGQGSGCGHRFVWGSSHDPNHKPYTKPDPIPGAASLSRHSHSARGWKSVHSQRVRVSWTVAREALPLTPNRTLSDRTLQVASP